MKLRVLAVLVLLVGSTIVVAADDPLSPDSSGNAPDDAQTQRVNVTDTTTLPIAGPDGGAVRVNLTDLGTLPINGTVQLVEPEDEPEPTETSLFKGKQLRSFTSEKVFNSSELLDFLGIGSGVGEFDRCYVLGLAFDGRGAIKRELVYERSGFEPIVEETEEVIFLREARHTQVETTNITTSTLTISSEERADDLQFRLTLEGGHGGDLEFRTECFEVTS